jgi:predicted nucleic acid-binding protein
MKPVYLLDTNILSYFIKGVSPALTRKMAKAMQAQTVVTSAICRAELRYGQGLMATADKRHTAIDLLLLELPALPWTAAAADHYGTLRSQFKRQGTPIGEFDTQIAAHAWVENLILVTHNTKHFERVEGLKMQDWLA